MRVELLFLRWLLVIALVALAIVYVRSSRSDTKSTQYETIRLIQGGQSAGMPLAGIAIDPNRRDVYAIVGGPASDDPNREFCIVWRGKGGESYGAAFPQGRGADKIFEVSANGQVKTMHNLVPNDPAGQAPAGERMASAETALRSIVDAFPSNLELP
ncbi:MAG TPA: hypothetical protein VK474_02055 [Chthoniobacterales bacterium]|nr:hypothetical protein [Chthoniobacterales bacterium]